MSSELVTFEYAFDGKNERPWWKFWIPKDLVFGTIAAKTEQQALEALRKRASLEITNIRPLSGVGEVVRRRLFHPRVPFETALDFVGNYATMTEGGVLPRDACETLAEDAKNPYVAHVFRTLGGLVGGGTAKLWQGCEYFPDVFSRYVVAVIRSGEDQGAATLQTVLRDLEDELRNKGRLRDQWKGVRDSLMTTGGSVALMLGVFLFGFVPVMIGPQGLAGDLSTLPPFVAWVCSATLSLFDALTNVIVDAGIVVAALIGWVIFQRWLRTDGGRYWQDSYVLSIKYGEVGHINAIHCQAEVLRAYARLYEISTDPFVAWSESAATADNVVYEEVFLEIRDRVRVGRVSLAQAMRDTGRIDKRVIAMIKAAEPNGPDVLAKRMMRVSEDLRQESTTKLERLTRRVQKEGDYAFAGIIIFLTIVSLIIFGGAIVSPH